jgi:hypothetical protein
MMIYRDDGSSLALTASGAMHYTREQTLEMHELLGEVRKAGRGSPRLVVAWLQASARPRALQPILEERLRDRGVEVNCPICVSPNCERAERCDSTFGLYNRFGISASSSRRREHRAHSRKRRR